MRSIITLVFIMFIAGYSLNLEKRGTIAHSNVSHSFPSQSEGNNIFTAMLAKYPLHNETSHENSTFSESDLLQLCSTGDRNFQNNLPPAATEVSLSGAERPVYQHSLLDISEGMSTLASFRGNSKRDLHNRTDSEQRKSSI